MAAAAAAAAVGSMDAVSCPTLLSANSLVAVCIPPYTSVITIQIIQTLCIFAF